MITFIGALLGFFSSAFPELLKVYRDQKDRIHELRILDRQMQMIQQGHHYRLEEINSQIDGDVERALYNHAKPTGVRWVDALAGTVRPIITYAFFILYAALKYAQWSVAEAALGGSHWSEAFLNIWHLEDQALFATVVSFWFGQRMLQKMRPSWSQK